MGFCVEEIPYCSPFHPTLPLQPRIEQFSSWLSVVVAKQMVEPPKIHKNMKKDFISVRPSGSEKNEPKVIGKVLNEYFRSNEPLAVAYRDRLFRDLFPDTHLCVDLKLITCEPGRMPVGAMLDGAITRDGEYHFTFLQNSPEKKRVVVRQRNPHVYIGRRINVNRKDDGTLYPTFNRPKFTRSFTFRDFCQEAAEELMAVAGLVENNQQQGM